MEWLIYHEQESGFGRVLFCDFVAPQAAAAAGFTCRAPRQAGEVCARFILRSPGDLA